MLQQPLWIATIESTLSFWSDDYPSYILGSLGSLSSLFAVCYTMIWKGKHKYSIFCFCMLVLSVCVQRRKMKHFLFQISCHCGWWGRMSSSLNRPTCRSAHPIPTYQPPSQLATFFVRPPFNVGCRGGLDERPLLHRETTRLKGWKETDLKRRWTGGRSSIVFCPSAAPPLNPGSQKKRSFAIWRLQTGKRQIMPQFKWSPRLGEAIPWKDDDTLFEVMQAQSKVLSDN